MSEKKIVYIDGVFDLFHRGHLESLLKSKNILSDPENTILLVGVISDKDCISYKREPIINESDRVELIKNIKCVDGVIFPAPLIVNKEFLDLHKIDIIVHGFSNEQDREKQKDFYEQVSDKFMEIEYYKLLSTTLIINKIKNLA